MKFSNKLSFAILITGMVILILSSLTVYKFSYDSVIKSEFSHTKSIADEVSDDIDQLLHEKVKTALTLANTPIIKNALETSILSYANLSDEKRKESIKRKYSGYFFISQFFNKALNFLQRGYTQISLMGTLIFPAGPSFPRPLVCPTLIQLAAL